MPCGSSPTTPARTWSRRQSTWLQQMPRTRPQRKCPSSKLSSPAAPRHASPVSEPRARPSGGSSLASSWSEGAKSLPRMAAVSVEECGRECGEQQNDRQHPWAGYAQRPATHAGLMGWTRCAPASTLRYAGSYRMGSLCAQPRAPCVRFNAEQP